MRKLKKKLAGQEDFTDFGTYLNRLAERIQFVSNETPIELDQEIIRDLNEIHTNCEQYFHMIQPLTVRFLFFLN